MPKSRHRKSAPARPHHPRPKAIHPRVRKMTHHDSPPGGSKPRMTQNDSLFQASNPQMTQNDSLFQASMPQMSQNDSHFEVSSFEMSQNDSFSGLKCPSEHPLSVADEPPATPPSPQNDTLSNTRPEPMGNPPSFTPLQSRQGRRPRGILIVASSCFPRLVIPIRAKNLIHTRDTLSCAQGDNRNDPGGNLA